MLKPVFVHFVWDKDDVEQYKKAKKSEETAKSGTPLTDTSVWEFEVLDLAKYCRRTTRGLEETKQLISSLIQEMDTHVDTMATPLISLMLCPVFGRCSRSIYPASKM